MDIELFLPVKSLLHDLLHMHRGLYIFKVKISILYKINYPWYWIYTFWRSCMDVYFFLYQVTLEVDLIKQSPTKPNEWLAIEQNVVFENLENVLVWIKSPDKLRICIFYAMKTSKNACIVRSECTHYAYILLCKQTFQIRSVLVH